MEQNNKTPLYKRILAIAGIALLLGMYVNLFIKAITGSPETMDAFIMSAAATVAVPIVIWVLVWAIGNITGRHTIASLDILSSDKEHDKYGNVVPEGKINTVVFDIGNVLTDFAWREFIKNKGYSDEEVERIGKASVMTEDWNQVDLGILSWDEIVAKFVENYPEIKEDLEKVFANVDNIETKRDAAIPWIKALKAAGYKVLYLSNFSQQVLDGCPEAMAFLDETDGGILSYRDQVTKPNPEIYNLLAKRYDLVPEKTVFIDDTVRNVEAARNLGWNGIVFKDYKQVYEELKELGVEY